MLKKRKIRMSIDKTEEVLKYFFKLTISTILFQK